MPLQNRGFLKGLPGSILGQYPIKILVKRVINPAFLVDYKVYHNPVFATKRNP